MRYPLSWTHVAANYGGVRLVKFVGRVIDCRKFCLTKLLDGRSVGQEIVLLGKILGRGRDWMAREEVFLI